MQKIIVLCLVSLILLNSCTGNRFLKQRYTHFKNNGKSSESSLAVNSSHNEKQPIVSQKIADKPVFNTEPVLTAAVIKTNSQVMDVIKSQVAKPAFMQNNFEPPLSISVLSEKQLTKKEQKKKFIFGLIKSVLGLVLFILVIILIITLLFVLL